MKWCIQIGVMDKKERQKRLANIIHKQQLSSQEALLSALKSEGIEAGQATISRDMRELGVSKRNNFYYIEGAQTRLENWQRVFQERIHYVEQAGPYILVAKGILGCASTISVEVEALGWKEIVGVIAGDDTLFFAFKNEKDLKKIKKVFKDTLQTKN